MRAVERALLGPRMVEGAWRPLKRPDSRCATLNLFTFVIPFHHCSHACLHCTCAAMRWRASPGDFLQAQQCMTRLAQI